MFEFFGISYSNESVQFIADFFLLRYSFLRNN